VAKQRARAREDLDEAILGGKEKLWRQVKTVTSKRLLLSCVVIYQLLDMFNVEGEISDYKHRTLIGAIALVTVAYVVGEAYRLVGAARAAAAASTEQ